MDEGGQVESLRLRDNHDKCTRRWHDYGKRQKIPLSCHNNPNLFEGGATLERIGEEVEKTRQEWKQTRGQQWWMFVHQKQGSVWCFSLMAWLLN